MNFFLEGRPVPGAVRKFKCPLKKPRSFCPCSSALNSSGKRLNKMTQTGALLNVEHIERRHMTDVYCRTDVTTGKRCSIYM